MKQPQYERRVAAAYRVLYPCKPSPRGAKAWFRRALLKTGMSISTKGVSRWLAGEHPLPKEAQRVLKGLESDARLSLRQQGKTLG